MYHKYTRAVIMRIYCTRTVQCTMYNFDDDDTHLDQNKLCRSDCLTLIKGACQLLPNEGHVGDFSPTETALLEKILQCPA